MPTESLLRRRAGSIGLLAASIGGAVVALGLTLPTSERPQPSFSRPARAIPLYAARAGRAEQQLPVVAVQRHIDQTRVGAETQLARHSSRVAILRPRAA